jgi:hypothetical protein
MARSLLASLGVLMMLVTTPVFAQTGKAPVEIVQDLYRLSAGPDGKWDHSSAFFDHAIRARLFSTDMRRAVARADSKDPPGEVGWMDFDPISASQDPGVYDLKITLVTSSPTNASVLAAFHVGPEPDSQVSRVYYDFVLEAKAWKLDDIRGESGTPPEHWSVRTMAKETK